MFTYVYVFHRIEYNRIYEKIIHYYGIELYTHIYYCTLYPIPCTLYPIPESIVVGITYNKVEYS